jgi:hypothetical protein
MFSAFFNDSVNKNYITIMGNKCGSIFLERVFALSTLWQLWKHSTKIYSGRIEAKERCRLWRKKVGFQHVGDGGGVG